MLEGKICGRRGRGRPRNWFLTTLLTGIRQLHELKKDRRNPVSRRETSLRTEYKDEQTDIHYDDRNKFVLLPHVFGTTWRNLNVQSDKRQLFSKKFCILNSMFYVSCHFLSVLNSDVLRICVFYRYIRK